MQAPLLVWVSHARGVISPTISVPFTRLLRETYEPELLTSHSQLASSSATNTVIEVGCTWLPYSKSKKLQCCMDAHLWSALSHTTWVSLITAFHSLSRLYSHPIQSPL